MNEEEERLMYISISPHKSIQLFKPVWKCFFLKQESFLVIQFNMCFTYGTHFQSWTFLYPPAFCLREVLAHTDTAWGHDLLLYCPHLEEREERPILKMASNGGILSSSTKIFRRERSFEYMCVYIQMMPLKSSLSSSFSVIAIMIALSPMLVLHCGKLLLPSLFPRQINHQFLSFTAIVSRWSDDLTMMPTTLMHWAHSVSLGAFSSKDEFSEKFKTAFDPSPSFLENHIAISLQFHVHPSWKIESYMNNFYFNLNNELSYVKNWGRSWHWQDRQIGSGIKVVFAQQTSIGNNAFSKEPFFQFGWNLFFVQSVLGSWPFQP